MKLCNRKHPDCARYINGKTTFWGGRLGDLPLKQTCPYFSNITIHRTLTRTVAQLQDGSWYELRDSKSQRCCAAHEREAEILKIAQLASSVQTSPIMIDKNNLNSFARAFILARKIANKKRYA